jgi:DNA-directed RNA polymerase specialized sigma24 family protein
VDPCESDDLADVRPGPEDVARQQELLAAVRSCAGRLKGVRREAYLLRYVRKLDRASAAREVGISVNAFDLRLFQANRAVRACLESKGFRP